MDAIFVTIRVKEQFCNDFIQASLGDAVGSVKDEPSCLRFDVLSNTEDPTVFYLYEVYKNAHQKLHLSRSRFLKWQETVNPMIEGRESSVVMDTIFPDEDVWTGQKKRIFQSP